MEARKSVGLFATACVLSTYVAALQGQQTNVDRDLEEAKILYREARFTDAIVRLQATIGRLKLLENLQGRRADLADAYLHLGLSYFGLRDLPQAKEQLKNVLRIAPDRRLDPQTYAPHVIQLLKEAREELERPAAASPIPAPKPSPSASSAVKKGGSKALPILLGVAAAGGLGVAVAGGGGGGVSSAAPTPAPTPTPPINNIDFVSSAPAPGGVIHTGLPDPASSRSAGVTTGLMMTFTVVSAVDRLARFQVSLESPQNGVCLTNAALAPPFTPVIQLQAGVPVTVTIRELLLTSVCRYPNTLTLATARLMPASAADPDQTPFYEERFALQYSVVE